MGDGRYRHVCHQQGRGASGQENRTVQNAKAVHPVSKEATIALGRQQEQRAPNEPPVDQLGAVKSKQGRGARFWPMARQSPTQRKSRGGHSRAEKGSRSKDKDQDRGRD
jgi:hypothetical protein